MFRKTSKSKSLDLFSNQSGLLSPRSQTIYENEQSWHNIFFKEVTCRIDEEAFRVLYCSNNGTPNASVSQMIAMMILKESQGWSDEQLFEHARFNILVRRALGLFNLSDSIPSPSTYYLFRKHIVEWEKAGNGNLLEKVFAQVTHDQALDFIISGKCIRMDSKLIGSNIAWYSRYELVHETLRQSLESIDIEHIPLTETDRQMLQDINSETGEKVSYRSSKEELSTKMEQLGGVIYKLLKAVEEPCLQILRRVFSEQYKIEASHIQVRPKAEISASSVQSPHDTDCTYRNKDGNQVKGYSVNVTETCDEGNLNLITDVQVDIVSTADNAFLQTAITRTQEIVPETIETVITDGAYHSTDNQEFCKESKIEHILGAIQGKTSRFDLFMDKNNNLIVTDKLTNTPIEARKIISRNTSGQEKWVIKYDGNKTRYFDQKQIAICQLRKQIASIPQSVLNRRNNVEATIFQLGYHYSNDKSRYRGLIKHKMWANIRCLWVNFVRIVKFVTQNGLIYGGNANLRLFFSVFFSSMQKIRSAISFLPIFVSSLQKWKIYVI